MRSDEALQLRLNLAGSGIGEAHSFTSAPYSTKARAADMGGDRFVDLLVSSSNLDRLQVFCDEHNTSFTALLEIPLFRLRLSYDSWPAPRRRPPRPGEREPDGL